jgi:membrane-bound metal-dependent hydrolase YbcI (DUF457 family)
MPSPVAHILTGLAIAVAAAPADPVRAVGTAPRAGPLIPVAVTCAALAALPDLDLLLAGTHRTASHSVVAVALVTFAAAAIAKGASVASARRIAVLCGSAYASHLLLDWLGTDNQNPPFGIQLFWPIERWYISGWDLFRSTERRQIFSSATIAHNLRTLVQEVGLLLPVLAATWFVRRRWRR